MTIAPSVALLPFVVALASAAAPTATEKPVPPVVPTSEQKAVHADLRQGLSKQVQGRLEADGESVTVMVCGQTGASKTSLLANLFQRQFEWPAGKRTDAIQTKVVKLNLGGEDGRQAAMPFVARLIDSPGYGDRLKLTRSFDYVTEFVEAEYKRALNEEQRIRRQEAYNPTASRHVDVVLYLFSPHRCTGLDLEFLKRLCDKVPIVPVLAKADTMTSDELAKFRREVSDALAAAGVPVAHPPFAVICTDAESPKGRAYPWGTAKAEDDGHSELKRLRRFLLTDGLLQLKSLSHKKYEAYRSKALRKRRLGSAIRFSACLGLAAALSVGEAARGKALSALADFCRRAPMPWVPTEVKVTWRRLLERPAALPATTTKHARRPLF